VRHEGGGWRGVMGGRADARGFADEEPRVRGGGLTGVAALRRARGRAPRRHHSQRPLYQRENSFLVLYS
jgi:hypothetical protein